MDNTPIEDPGTPPPGLDGTVRFLKILVTTLTVTTIVGLIVLISVIVMRVQQNPPLALPARVALPEGTSPIAITQGPGWYAIVSEDSRILVFDTETGALIQEVTIVRP